MSDEIKVGDRVQEHGIDIPGRIVGITKDGAWITRSGKIAHLTALCYLTLIPPENVALTPKYLVGSKVRLKEEHTTATHIVEIQGVSVAYTFENWATRLEKDLEPVCLHCKGTGVSE